MTVKAMKITWNGQDVLQLIERQTPELLTADETLTTIDTMVAGFEIEVEISSLAPLTDEDELAARNLAARRRLRGES